jgi:hypothetical protein
MEAEWESESYYNAPSTGYAGFESAANMEPVQALVWSTYPEHVSASSETVNLIIRHFALMHVFEITSESVFRNCKL